MKKRRERIENSCGDLSIDYTASLADDLHEPLPDESLKHPTPELLLIREAVKYLTQKQRQVWEYHAYDKLTQEEIANKLSISRQMVQQHIQAAERRIAKWCKSNMGAYELLKSDFEAAE